MMRNVMAGEMISEFLFSDMTFGGKASHLSSWQCERDMKVLISFYNGAYVERTR